MAFVSTGAHDVGQTEEVIFTPPAQTKTGETLDTATVIGLSASNIHDSPIIVTMKLFKSNDTQEYHIIKDVEIMPGATEIIVGGEQKMIVEQGDEIRAFGFESGDDTIDEPFFDVIVSYLESAEA